MNEITEKKPLIILTGPTAVGKTKLSIALAKEVNGEIISADSMQVYKYMDIGTAKIKPDEMHDIKHYLIDEFDPREEFNIVKFQKYAKEAIREIYQKGKVPIIAGGTGFYIQSVLYDIDFKEEDTDTEYRNDLTRLYHEKGSAFLHDMLKNVDEKSAAQIHENNVKRVIRALEFYKKTGTLMSAHNEEERERSSPYHYAYFVLNHDRQILYNTIDKRVDQMLEQGLVEEVEQLIEQGYERSLVSMQGLGYKELYAYLEGESTLEETIYILKRDTRHFAKRQLTWFKRENEVIWLDKQNYLDEEQILNEMIMTLKNKAII